MLFKEKIEPQRHLAVCATCPWRRKLQGTKHPAGWYKLSNLRRLWNGIRTGNAPGMVCHASDPKAIEYGSTKPAPEGTETRECAGALQLVYLEVEAFNQASDLRIYRRSRKSPMTRYGLGHWAQRWLFGKPPAIVPCEDVGLPWVQVCRVYTAGAGTVAKGGEGTCNQS